MTASSQTDTNKICLPYETAKKIAIDLASGDSAKAELQATKEVLSMTEKKVVYKDSIITTYQQKELNYQTQIVFYKEKERIYNDRIVLLETRNRNLKLSVGVLGGTTLLAAILIPLL